MLDTYYIDYYDMNDGWLGFEYVSEYRKEWIFTNWNDADVVKNVLNEKLSFGNVRYGEYFDVKQTPSPVPLQVPENLTGKIGNL